MKKNQELPTHNHYHVLSALEGICKYPVLANEQINGYLYRIGKQTQINSILPFPIETVNASLVALPVIGQFLDKPSKQFIELMDMEPELTIWLFHDSMIKGGNGLCVVIKGNSSGIIPRVHTWLESMKGKKRKLFLTKTNDDTLYMAAPLNSFF